MARTPDPPVQLRQMLTVARRQSVPFEDAWPAALRKVRWPHPTRWRTWWKSHLGDAKRVPTPPETLEIWRAAYERREVPGGAVLVALIAAVNEPDERPVPRAWVPLTISAPESGKKAAA